MKAVALATAALLVAMLIQLIEAVRTMLSRDPLAGGPYR